MVRKYNLDHGVLHFIKILSPTASLLGAAGYSCPRRIGLRYFHFIP